MSCFLVAKLYKLLKKYNQNIHKSIYNKSSSYNIFSFIPMLCTKCYYISTIWGYSFNGIFHKSHERCNSEWVCKRMFQFFIGEILEYIKVQFNEKIYSRLKNVFHLNMMHQFFSVLIIQTMVNHSGLLYWQKHHRQSRFFSKFVYSVLENNKCSLEIFELLFFNLEIGQKDNNSFYILGKLPFMFSSVSKINSDFIKHY